MKGDAKRAKNHHFVPRFLLRGFARDGELLTGFDVSSKKSFPIGVASAAAENDLYTVELEDGSLSDAVETAMAEQIEGPAADAFRSLVARGCFENQEQLVAAARFVALQYLRTPATRSDLNDMSDDIFKLKVAAEGPQGARRALEALGEPTDDDAVAEMWRSMTAFDEYAIEMPTEYHVQQMIELVEEFTPILIDLYTWGVIRWERKALLLADQPMLLVPDPAMQFYGVGVLSALGIWLPLGRRTALNLARRPKPMRYRFDVDLTLPGTAQVARQVNRAMFVSARRQVFRHPDDSLADLLGADWSMPDKPAQQYQSNSDDLRDRLTSMGNWMIANPGQPHPMVAGPTDDREPWSPGWVDPANESANEPSRTKSDGTGIDIENHHDSRTESDGVGPAGRAVSDYGSEG